MTLEQLKPSITNTSLPEAEALIQSIQDDRRVWAGRNERRGKRKQEEEGEDEDE